MNDQSQQNKPLITVAMVTYNSAKYLRTAIHSVLNSTYTNIELLICDDHSKDNSWDIIQSYTDSRIRSFQNIPNLGEYANRNKCINLAQGEYLIFIDGDDYLYAHGLDHLMQNIASYPTEPISMIIGRSWDENMIYPCLVDNKEFTLANFVGKQSLMALNFTRILFNTKLLQASGGFDLKYRIGDYYIQHLLGSKHKVLIVQEGFAWWRRNAGQASEGILFNGEAEAEAYHIRNTMLKSNTLPLNSIEIELCKKSNNRDFGRFLLRKLFQFKLGDFRKLFLISNYKFVNFSCAFDTDQKTRIYSNISEKNISL